VENVSAALYTIRINALSSDGWTHRRMAVLSVCK